MKNNSTDLMEMAQASYEVNGEEIKLSPIIVKKYLVSGDANKVTDQEVMMFIKLCQYQKLNPFLREAYLIKYGQQSATLVTGKDTFTKRAANSKVSNGYEAGIIVFNLKKEIEFRNGTFYMQDKEKLLGGWAKAYRKDKDYPVEISVNLNEYIGKKKDGSINSQWAQRPGTMIRKVALVQALREAFPEDFEGMYSPEEIGVDDKELKDNKIDIKEEFKKEHEVEEPPRPVQKEQKEYIFEIAKQKGLADGKDVEGLEKFAQQFGYSLRALTYDIANDLLKKLEEYNSGVIEAEYEEVNEDNQVKFTEEPF
ncbi:phage recombination protein Bet [Clostridium tetani]|uniref:phage recombination protein Bet n=1 Tax=Clostridium tetani TaxID=1513 RepID=UPI00100BF88F|nr:phage recombination protein Bet [Clostridium tetani]RXM77187.1 phage recombination protein Bet [Clostridium tetani]RYU99432.1 phage recombination protein Bet [Clostridium tetani]